MKINYCIGLPRSGSTLLMNILQQNETIFTSSTCPTSYLLDACKNQAINTSEFIAMDQDALSKCLHGYIKSGTEGWFKALTSKENIISKSRCWDVNLNMLFSLYDDPKFIVCLRDIRDIICSFEKLANKYPMWDMFAGGAPIKHLPFEERIKHYCQDTSANLGRPLYYIKHVFEWMQKRPNNFYIFRYEDFNENPHRSLNSIYDWLELPNFQHDLNNIKPAEQYEHDTAYRSLVSHKTESVFRKNTELYKKYMNQHQSDLVIHNNQFFYKTFYPEII